MEWISVKDRLPETRVDVLCYGKITSCGLLHYEQCFYNGKTFLSRRDHNYSHITITHWMLLPEPPKI